MSAASGEAPHADGGLPEPLREWIAAQAGGEVARIVRQGRGRPAYEVDVEGAGGERLLLYLRCHRGVRGGINEFYTIEREAELLRALGSTAVPVPRVHGFNDEFRALLMQRLPGAVDFHGALDPDERERVARDYMRVLAAQHQIEARSLGLSSFEIPRTPREHALANAEIWFRIYERTMDAPDPVMSFAIRWLRANPPARVERTSLVQGDTGVGQFLFEHGHVTGVVDWELAHFGDPIEDLAMIRMRSMLYPFGDLRELFRVYSEHSGIPVDPATLRYYSVRALLNAPLSLLGSELRRPDPRSDLAERLAWTAIHKRGACQALAEAMEIELETPLPPDPPEATPHSLLYDAVLQNLRDEQLPALTDSYRAHRMRATIFLFEHLRQKAALGPLLDREDADELARVLGRRPSDPEQGSRALDEAIRQAEPRRSAELLAYLYRRCCREEHALGGALDAVGPWARGATLPPV